MPSFRPVPSFRSVPSLLSYGMHAQRGAKVLEKQADDATRTTSITRSRSVSRLPSLLCDIFEDHEEATGLCLISLPRHFAVVDRGGLAVPESLLRILIVPPHLAFFCRCCP